MEVKLTEKLTRFYLEVYSFIMQSLKNKDEEPCVVQTGGGMMYFPGT